ncbi:hypothetical protein AcV7_006127 [Taiwanofungus camphoratus]|nr:hypothetical protein AcV7_006127 [Antrodia cinnamomea]
MTEHRVPLCSAALNDGHHLPYRNAESTVSGPPPNPRHDYPPEADHDFTLAVTRHWIAPTLNSSPALAALHALSATKPLDRTALPKPSSPQTLPSSSTSQGQHRQSVPRLCTSPAATLGGLRTPLVLCAAFGVPEPICVVA